MLWKRKIRCVELSLGRELIRILKTVKITEVIKIYLNMCPLTLKLSSVLKLLILTTKIPVRIKTR